MSNPDETMAAYAREVSLHDVMKHAEEVAMARRFIELEVRLWVELLSSKKEALPILGMLAPLLEKSRTTADCGPVVAAFEKLLSSWNLRTKEEFARTARSFDLDREWLMEAVRIARNSPNEERARRIATAFEEVCAVKNEFVSRNLRLVVSFASRQRLFPGVERGDLIQEGNMGLIRALEKFDPGRGFRFSTYAAWWIRHSINRFVADKGRSVRIPVHLFDAAKKVKRCRLAWVAQMNEEPSVAQISKNTGIEPHKVTKILELDTGPSLSLDAEIGSEKNARTWLDLIPSTTEPPDEPCEREALAAEIEPLLDRLPLRERRVICWRFGLRNFECLTLQEVGDMYGVSRERIRQLESTALEKLRKWGAERLVEFALADDSFT